MKYRILADLVVIVHFGFALFVALGGLLVWRWRHVIWFHLPAAFWGILIEFTDWRCPLTPLENWLRRLGGERGYPGDFIAHYLVSALYPEQLTRGFQMTLGLAVLGVNLLIYWRILSRSRSTRSLSA